MVYTLFETELCKILLAGEKKTIKHLILCSGNSDDNTEAPDEWERDDDSFSGIIIQIKDFLNGKSKSFDVDISPSGSNFQKLVWERLVSIPYGKTKTYGQIAEEIGKPGAARAVGAACGRNPIPIIIPCHRVVGKNGNLTGYAYGLGLKSKLIEIENPSPPDHN